MVYCRAGFLKNGNRLVMHCWALVARLFMWGTKVSFWSRMTPKYFASLVYGIAWLNNVSGGRGGIRLLLVNITAWVLSGFILILHFVDHSKIL